MTATAVLRVRHAGPLVSFQDAGRPRLMRFGIPASGPMDPFTHAAANVVLGRPARSTAIEVSLGGLIVECIAGPVTVSVCGGGFNVDHAGQRSGSWTVRTLEPGDVLQVTAGAWGSWCYLGAGGDLRSVDWLGSSSTHVRAELGGGLIGRGDELVIDNATAEPSLDGDIQPAAGGRPITELRVVLGPQLECFRPEAISALLGGTYTLTAAYDRMGVRLDGPPLPLDNALAIPSTPIVRGSIQVAGDGVATLLFADHQTTGGYPKIATVIADDTIRASQLRAGDAVTFTAVDPPTAIRLARVAAASRRHQLAALANRPELRTRHLVDTNLISGVFHHETDGD